MPHQEAYYRAQERYRRQPIPDSEPLNQRVLRPVVPNHKDYRSV